VTLILAPEPLVTLVSVPESAPVKLPHGLLPLTAALVTVPPETA